MDSTAHHVIAGALDVHQPKRKRVSNAPAMCAELLKLLRSEALTELEVIAELGWGRNAVARWLKEMTDNGLIEAVRPEKPPSHRGLAARTYRLSKKWGGT